MTFPIRTLYKSKKSLILSAPPAIHKTSIQVVDINKKIAEDSVNI